MNSIINCLIILVLSATVVSCEKVVELELPKGESIPYVDAWITDQPGIQTIKFLKATDYMSEEGPEPISGAEITLTDLTENKTYPFTYNDGAYSYNAGTETIGEVGHSYKLRIEYNGEIFEATDDMKRVTAIDSVTYKYQEEGTGEEAGFYAKLYARDLAGAVDYYWIRTYRNNQLNYYVGEMLCVDGAFGEEGVTDGFAFIPPFRDGITSGEEPYVKGDNVKVMIRSLSKNSYDFMNQAVTQLSNQGMFAEVLKNVPANLQNQQASSKTKIYGWFGTVAETSMSLNIE
jgi:hypothetical protein